MVDWSLNRNPKVEKVNIIGLENVIQACIRHRVRRLIYTSTMDVVLSATPISKGTESKSTYPAKPANDYVRTKVQGERMVLNAHDSERTGLMTCCMRPGHIYGERDPHALRTVVETVRSGNLPFLLGDPADAKFDVVYADNIAHAHILAAIHLNSHDAPHGGKAYFISENNHVNWWEFVRPYVQCKGLALPKRHIPAWIIYYVALLTEILHWFVSFFTTSFDPTLSRFIYYLLCQDFNFVSDRAKADFGYEPIVPSNEGQRRTLVWMREQDV
jgi:nucleoside-diphosphate-sugar epimerase